MATFRGFILQPTYRVESGVPVLHLFGRLEDGRSFLVRDRRLVPRFYVEERDAVRAREKGAQRQVPTDQVTLLGRPVVRVEVREPADAPPLRDRLEKAGIRTYEADVRFAMRHLIDRGVRGSIEIHGEGREAPGLGLVFEDPEVGPADWTPRLSVLSLDIETDPAARRLLAIGLHGCDASEVLLLTPPGRGCPDGARPFPTEKELLAAFCARVRELDPDVLTGWNVVDFDLTVLDRIAGPNGVPLELGRGPGTLRLRAEAEIVEPQAGGHVLEPLPGLYTNVVVLDFKSLCPSLIRTFEIDPLNLIRAEAVQADADPIVAPNGAAFVRRKGILSEIPGREERGVKEWDGLDDEVPRRCRLGADRTGAEHGSGPRPTSSWSTRPRPSPSTWAAATRSMWTTMGPGCCGSRPAGWASSTAACSRSSRPGPCARRAPAWGPGHRATRRRLRSSRPRSTRSTSVRRAKSTASPSTARWSERGLGSAEFWRMWTGAWSEAPPGGRDSR